MGKESSAGYLRPQGKSLRDADGEEAGSRSLSWVAAVLLQMDVSPEAYVC